jgi:hypothetical protein
MAEVLCVYREVHSSFCLAFGRTPPVGCCGMDSVIDLYGRVKVGAKVIVI